MGWAGEGSKSLTSVLDASLSRFRFFLGSSKMLARRVTFALPCHVSFHSSVTCSSAVPCGKVNRSLFLPCSCPLYLALSLCLGLVFSFHLLFCDFLCFLYLFVSLSLSPSLITPTPTPFHPSPPPIHPPSSPQQTLRCGPGAQLRGSGTSNCSRAFAPISCQST